MKKTLLTILFTLIPIASFAAFNSGQLSTTTATNGFCLTTNTATNIWASCGGASLSGGSPNTLTYWTSATGVGATTSPTVGYITATSSATSSFAGPIAVQNGGLTYDGDQFYDYGNTGLKGAIPQFRTYDIYNHVIRYGSSFNNFLTNASFESWFAGTSVAPTGWTLQGATAARVADPTTDTYAAQVTFTNADDQIRQSFTATSTVWYTYSLYVKRISGSGVASLVAQEDGGSFTEYNNTNCTAGATYTVCLLTFKKAADGVNSVRFKFAQQGATASVWEIDEAMLQEGNNVATSWLPQYIDGDYAQNIYGAKTFYTAPVFNSLSNFTLTATNGSGTLISTSTPTVNAINSTTTATSTFIGGLSADILRVSSSTASSTFANGINLQAGCFAINNVCVTGGGGSQTPWASAINGGGFGLSNTGSTTIGAGTAISGLTISGSATTTKDFIFDYDSSATTRNIFVTPQLNSNTAGNGLTITSGKGNGSGSGALFRLIAGSGGATSGTGGAFQQLGGDGGAPNGNGGAVSVAAGQGAGTGSGGETTIRGGPAASAASVNRGGNAYIQGGSGQGSSVGSAAGDTYVRGGNSVSQNSSPGRVFITGGIGFTGGGTGGLDGGNVYIQGGAGINDGGGNIANAGNLYLQVATSSNTGTVGTISIVSTSSKNAFFQPSSLTADRTFTFPDVSGTYALGTGSTNVLSYWSDSNTLSATSGPTVNYITATSTSATSTFAGPIKTSVLLFGTTTTKQSTGGGGPESITNIQSASNKAFIYSGTTTDVNAQFLVQTNGFMGFGPGGGQDQDINFGRNGPGGITIQSGIINSTDAFRVNQISSTTGTAVFTVNTVSAYVATPWILVNGAGGGAKMDVYGGGTTAIRAEQPNSTDVAFSAFKTNDAQLRFSFLADGTQKWGGGAFVADTQLSRTASGTMTFQGIGSAAASSSFIIADQGSVGSTTPSASSTMVIQAGANNGGLATTTVTIGTPTRRFCIETWNDAGTREYIHIVGTTLTVNPGSCK